jgi:hypothetical protein
MSEQVLEAVEFAENPEPRCAAGAHLSLRTGQIRVCRAETSGAILGNGRADARPGLFCISRADFSAAGARLAYALVPSALLYPPQTP